jgi:tetratricopeptide (TPR) repeat protein
VTAATGESGLTRAAALLEVGRPQQALAELARLAAGAAEDPRAFRLRVEALIALDRWADAADMARQGLAVDATDAGLLGQFGLALHALGDYPGAEHALLDALALDPFDAVLLCRYALLCMSVGQLRKAGRLVAAAALSAPESAVVYATRVQLAFARGRDRAAEGIAAEFVGRYPSLPVALALYGRSTALRGRTVTAYDSFARAVAEDPTDEERARIAETLRVRTHPLLRPLRPLERMGPVGAWLATVVAFVVLRAAGLTPLAVLVAFVSFGYTAYSWVAPLLARHLTGPVPAGTDRPQGTVLPDTRWFRVLRWVVGIGIAVTALCCGGFAAVDIGPDARAATGKGTPGTIVLTTKDCFNGKCDWYGDFTSDDGRMRFPGASMQEGVPAGAKVGDRLPALDTGARDGVFPRTGSTEWVYAAMFLGFSLFILLGDVALCFLVPALLRRYRRR